MLPALFTGLLDDAAIFPPGNSPLEDAARAYAERAKEWYAGLVASFVVTDLRLPEVVQDGLPLSVVVTGGAGSVAGACGLVARAGAALSGLEIALRDPDDLAGNARRVVASVDAARAAGTLAEDTDVYVELPNAEPGAAWLAAADTVAEAGLRLKFRTGGVEAHLFPSAMTLAAWIDAALDRETPYKCTAGLHHAVAHTDRETGFAHHGFLNVLVATRAALDGGDVVSVLESRDAGELAADAAVLPESTRNWFTSFGTCSVLEPLEDLVGLGLVEAPAGTPGDES